MTDTATASNTPSVDQSVRGMYDQVMATIKEIDEKLDAGTEQAGKRKIINSLITEHQNVWAGTVQGLVAQMKEKMTPEQLASTYYGIIKELQKEFRQPTDTYVTELFEKQPQTETEQLTDEERDQLRSTRKDLATQVNTLVEMAANFGMVEVTGQDAKGKPLYSWPLPPRRGATGKRGKRALSLFTWTVDGEEMDEDNDSVKGVSEKLGFDKVSEFTTALKEQEVEGKKLNTTNPPDEFTVTIRGHEVTATRVTEDEEDELETSDDEPDEGEE